MPLTRNDQRVRRRARARALQAVYVWDIMGGKELWPVAERLWGDLAMGADERAMAAPLIHTLATERERIDELLSTLTENWRLKRLGIVERSLLRLGTAELLHPEPPAKVVIQEAVRLAERYGSNESARFVNGVLDAVARRLGRI